MNLTIDEIFQKAIAAHKNGKIIEAKKYYKEILNNKKDHPDANHNMGVLLLTRDDAEASIPFFLSAITADSTKVQFWISYVTALIRLNRIEVATEVCEDISLKFPNNDRAKEIQRSLLSMVHSTAFDQELPADQLRVLIDLYTQGELKKTLRLATETIQKYPKSSQLFNLLGVTNEALKNFNLALEHYRKALKLKPNYPEVCFNMGNVHKTKGDLDGAIRSYRKALKLKPDYPEVFFNIGNAQKAKGDLDGAIRSYRKALKLKPDYPEAYNNLGSSLRDNGNLFLSISSYRKALKLKWDYFEAHNNLGNVLREKGDLEASIRSYDQAITLKPDYIEAYINMGNVLREKGDLEASIRSYDQAIRVKPDCSEAFRNKGNAFQDLGELEMALKSYIKAVKIKPDNSKAHLNLSRIKTYKNKDKQFLQMQEIYRNNDISAVSRCHLCFALGKAYEDLGDIETAFKFFQEGNAIRKKQLDYDISHDQKLFFWITKTASRLFEISFDQKFKERKTNPIPIFIVGMPRSGTTLVEQIISSHSQVYGAGELNYVNHFGASLINNEKTISARNLKKFRQLYLNEINRISNGSLFVTDKMPQNFRFIGLIYKVFPESRIIHVKRNAAATCWSNYKQHFSFGGLGYCYNLVDLAKYFTMYSELMKYWENIYGDRISNVDYDQLTLDQEIETKRLIRDIGLDWEAKCLFPQENKRSIQTASNNQVRQKVYQGSSESWRKFEPFLGGVFDQL